MCIGFGSANAVLSVNSPAGVTNGTTSVVTIALSSNDDTPPIGSVQFDLQFDNTIIKNVSWVSNAIGTPGSNTGTGSIVGGNKFRLIWVPSDGTSTVAAGPSNLVSVTFRAIKPGSTSGLDFIPAGILFTDIAFNPITVTGTNGTFSVAAMPAPVASFTMNPVSGNIRTGNSVTFTNTSTGGTPDWWNWSFDSGATWTNVSNGNPQSHTYLVAGTYTASLTVSNAGGSSPATSTVNVYDLPVGNFVASTYTVGTTNPVTFDAANSTGSSLTYDWNWGDGTAHGSGVITTHAYSSTTGSPFTVTLTVSDPVGAGAPVTRQITVVQSPIPDFTANVSAVRTNGWVKFTDTTAGGQGITSWNWSFGDGPAWSNTTTSSSPEHQYTTNGTYIASLTVFNAVAPGTKTMAINVYDQPLGDFTGTPTTVMTGVPVTFNGTTTGFVTAWSWNFGAGASPATSTNRNETVTYSTGGLKTVTLTRSNPWDSNTTTKVDYITVTIPTLPIPRITSDVTTGNVPLVVTFSSATSDVRLPTTYAWTFGDGTTSAVANPVPKTYTIPGSYDVSLSITNASGTNTSTRVGYILANEVIIPIVPNSTAIGNDFSVNTTGNTVNYTSSVNTVTLTNVTGFSQIIVTMTGTVNTTGGNLSGTVASVQYFVNPINAFVEGQPISAGAIITESAWNTSGFTFSFTMTDATSNTVYIGLLPSGSTGYDPLAVIDITTSGPATRVIINMSVPLTWYNNYTNAGPTTAGQNFTLVMWTHGTPPVTKTLTPVWGPADPPSKWLTVDTGGFSMFAVIGAAAAPAPGPAPAPVPVGGGGGGGGGAYSGQYFTKTAKMLESDEGKVLDTYTIITGQQATFTVPLGTTVLGKDGKPLSTVTVQTTKPADVPAVPAGAVYTFGGYAVTCSPDGATFSPPASLKFFLTNEEWDTLLAKANGRVGYLTVMFYDTATGDWASVPTTVDPVAHTVTGSVSHFSTYGLFIDTSAVTPVVIEATPTITKVPTTAPAVAPAKTTAAPPAPGGETPWTMIIGVIVLIVIIAGVGYYFITKKQ